VIYAFCDAGKGDYRIRGERKLPSFLTLQDVETLGKRPKGLNEMLHKQHRMNTFNARP